jgi:triacylglycerol esterase/lipase EstA (alpha/beta hydrolase family)
MPRRSSVTHRIYLVPGFFGFSNLGELRYFTHVREFLEQCCEGLGIPAEIEVVKTYPTSSLPRRATRVLETIAASRSGNDPVHLIGHSSGGLDVRLAAAPNVSLRTDLPVERLARTIRTVVTVATPHHGTPLASFFASLLGQQLLQVLALLTVYVLRFGQLPMSVLLPIAAVFARLDERVGVNSALLDQLFGQLLEDFSADRRRAVQSFLDEVGKDQALVAQLTPEGMDLFNASTRDRPGVRYGCVLTRGHSPGVRTTLSAGLDPSAQLSHMVYHAIYRLAARMPRSRTPEVTRDQARALRRAFGTLPTAAANDGVIPTLSQAWGDVVHATQADHLDVIGHFADRAHVPPHYDWLASGSGFTRQRFEALWNDVACYIALGQHGVAKSPFAARQARGRPRLPSTRRPDAGSGTGRRRLPPASK